MRRRQVFAALMAVAACVVGQEAQAATVMLRPTVAELFTSQSCSSCPAADALLKQKAAADPALLVLSYHVTYWDHLGWKDPFSLIASTERQRGYFTALNEPVFYTPELVVNGAMSMIGSDENKVTPALRLQKIDMPPFNIEIAAGGVKRQLAASINLNGMGTVPSNVEAWEVLFAPYARTRIGAGENEGRTVESINNVTAVKRLGNLDRGSGHFSLQNPVSPKDGIAVIVQVKDFGPILAAATYQQ